jgi:cell division protein ZapE
MHEGAAPAAPQWCPKLPCPAVCSEDHDMSDATSRSYRARAAAGSISADPAQADVVEALDRVATELEAWDASRNSLSRWFGRTASSIPRGLYIHGGVGRGKTMLMDLFFETVGVSKKRRVHFHRFMADTHDAIARARHASEGDPLPDVAKAIAAEVQLLCFDEFHVTDIADAMILSRLFKGLFERGVVMVATSNAAPRQLYRNGLNRQLFLPCIELIESHMGVIELVSATDHRLAKLSGERMYFSPLGAASDLAMDRIWARMAGGEPGAAVTLDVKGRSLVLPRVSHGVARCEFADLCDQPLGSLDYLALADAVHVLMLDHVPKLTADRRNAARRFITLIDTLYDRRIGFIASADAAPDDLYVAGDGSDLFVRTASRLVEMQGAEYLSARTASR